ncbi:hypothetical protein M9H77_13507 [Catharanthus roseus]|uniref:Uncharacterized protein n=1 Tax=Catharanthus roseus TaxID=4058 RepID=A0ACC0BKI8_CATRO|nr:hypothetical protein M9H77_13507 [Catharanthus roseus]
MTKMRHAWEIKVGDWMRDFLGDAQGARKRPVWILEMYWEHMMKYWESPEYKAFCEQNKRNRNEGRGGQGVGKHTGEEISKGSAKGREGSCSHGLSGGSDGSWSYGAGLKAAHLRAENSEAIDGLPP